MPTYEYRCPEGHDFEKFVQKMSDAQSELPCPQCGVIAARRMSAGGGLVFKGSGFYITDYGKDGKKDQRAAAVKDGASGTSTSDSSGGSSGGSSDKAAASGTGEGSASGSGSTGNGSTSGSASSGSGSSSAASAPASAPKPAPSSDTSTKKSGPAQ